MPRLKSNELAQVLPKTRTPAQLANDARLRNRKTALIKSDDLDGAKTETNISATGETEVEHRQIEVVSEQRAHNKAAELAFMNEEVTVFIEADDNPDAPIFLHSANGGIDQYIQRGVPQKIKRKFLYSLIAGKKTAHASAFGKDGTGKEFNRLTGRTSTTHRISLLEDTPIGRARFAEWMAMPA